VGGGCPPEHENGLGQTFFHCNPVGVRTLESAAAAAQAWRPGGRPTVQVPGCSDCLGWETPSGETPSACAVWCYGSDPLGGRVALTPSPVCLCPTTASATWN
jgi:hypothetical protein